ncbi:MAG: BamA/TamA family outer membrane protein [Terriglobia bacterium]|nr:BamA/TamA family outer membrane protein [Terriglobia bacterium]
MAAQSNAGSEKRILHCVSLAAVALLVLSLSLQTAAQSKFTKNDADDQVPKTPPTTKLLLASYEGQNVSAIEIAGRPGLNVSRLTPLFAQRAGQPFSTAKVEQTIAAIKRTGKFSGVRLQVEPEANGIQVLLILEPAVYFGIFQFPGAERFAYSRLVEAANYPPHAPFNETEIRQDRDSLLTFIRGQGFFQATVDPQVQVDAAHAIANVVFHVTLNRRAKFGQVEIAGVPPQQATQLSDHLHGWIARFHRAGIRPGKDYNRSTVSKATQFLQSTLEKQGRLAAQVKLVGAEYHAASNRADIHFDVHRGPLVNVRIEGAHLWSWTRKSLLPVYQGIGVDPELVREGRVALVSYFQSKGYFHAGVESKFRKDSGVDTIVYQITKNKKYKVTSIAVSGNKQLPTDELLPHVSVEKAHFFSRGKYSQKLMRASVKNLLAVYQSTGFSSVQVTPKVTNQDRNIRVLFQIDEGPQDIVKSLRIEGDKTLAEAKFAPNGLKLAPGGPYAEKLVRQDRANILAHYLKAGYLRANFRETATAVSKSDPHAINVIYHIYEGPQVFTANVLTLGREHTQQRLINRDVASIQPRHPLTETQLLTAQSKLYSDTGVFDWAEVDPKRQITTQSKEDVLVKVHESKRNTITYGFGFEVINRGGSVPSGTVAFPNLPPIGLPSNFTTNQKTFYGPRGTFEYTRNNMRGNGSSLSLTAFAGRLDQKGAAYYIDPTLFWSKWRSTTSISIERDQENPIFSSQVDRASYEVQHFLDKGEANSLFLRYSFSKTDLTRIEIPALVPTQDRNVRLSTVSANFTRDTRDNPLNEHRGVLDTVELDFNSIKLGSSVDFAKLTAQSAYYKEISHNIVWANSIRIGLAQPFASSFVPLSEEFFTGGGNTLRGFPLDSAGPQRQVPVCSTGSSTNCSLIQVPTGGNEMLILNTELRMPLPIKKNLGIVTFYDGGNAFPYVGFHDFTSLYSNNVGLGLRYSTPVGPIRFDVGRNLNPVPGINATQYFVSIGQAF